MHEATEWTIIQTSLMQRNDSKVSGMSVVVDQVGLDVRERVQRKEAFADMPAFIQRCKSFSVEMSRLRSNYRIEVNVKQQRRWKSILRRPQ